MVVKSIRFYEILASYRRLGKATFEVEDIKKRLQILDKYKRHKDFRMYVITQAQKELKEKTDIYFEFTEERQGRKVARIHFTIYSQKKPQTFKNKDAKKQTKHQENKNNVISNALERNPLSDLQQKSDEILLRNGVDQLGRKRLIKSYQLDQIINNADLVLEKFKNGKIDNLAAATVRAIKEDWVPKKSPFEKEEEEKKQATIRANQKKEEEKILIGKLEKEFNKQRKEKAKKNYALKTENEKKVLINKFEESKHIAGVMKETYRKEGFDSIGIKILFESFLSEHLLEPVENDFIEWARKNKNVIIKCGSFNEYELSKN